MTKTCGECRFYIQKTSHCKLKGVGWKFATDSPCSGFTPKESTVFDRITASPEVLAEKLVCSEHWTITSESPEKGIEHEYWTSIFIDMLYPTKAEAIAATVAKLKEVYND